MIQKEEKGRKEDKTEQEEKRRICSGIRSGVVQMQRESRRKERVKENARNLAKHRRGLPVQTGVKGQKIYCKKRYKVQGL